MQPIAKGGFDHLKLFANSLAPREEVFSGTPIRGHGFLCGKLPLKTVDFTPSLLSAPARVSQLRVSRRDLSWSLVCAERIWNRLQRSDV
jgi:hypothetical protein